MSQKKPTTNQQLAEMREMIANMAPGKVVSVDRELQERNTALMLMLYGAVAKYGVGMTGAQNGVVVMAQLPALQVPANHRLDWEVSEDGKSVMLYIVLTDSPEADDPPQEEDVSESEPEYSVENSDLELPDKVIEPEDEFEDEVKVGLDD